MTAKSYDLTFDGYWREPNIGSLPARSGIYCVYVCTHDAQAKTVDLCSLLYIGEADDVRGRVAGHEKWPDWRAKLRAGQQLCFTAAVVIGKEDRQRAEAAEIFEHKPPCNTEYVDAFPFDRTTIANSGTVALLHARFTVERTENRASKLYSGFGSR